MNPDEKQKIFETCRNALAELPEPSEVLKMLSTLNAAMIGGMAKVYQEAGSHWPADKIEDDLLAKLGLATKANIDAARAAQRAGAEKAKSKIVLN